MINFELFPDDSYSPKLTLSFSNESDQVENLQIREGVELELYCEAIEKGLKIMGSRGFISLNMLVEGANSEILKQVVNQYKQIKKCYFLIE